MPDAPPPGTTPTCDTAGIIGPIINVIASWQAAEAMKILSGHPEAISRTLSIFDLWENRVRQIQLDSIRDNQSCDACQRREFPWLDGQRGSHTAVLCGRNAVQLTFPNRRDQISLSGIADKLKSVGQVKVNPFLTTAKC